MSQETIVTCAFPPTCRDSGGSSRAGKVAASVMVMLVEVRPAGGREHNGTGLVGGLHNDLSQAIEHHALTGLSASCELGLPLPTPMIARGDRKTDIVGCDRHHVALRVQHFHRHQ